MTTAGWAFMLTVWTVLTVVLIWCYVKILGSKKLSDEAVGKGSDNAPPFTM